LPQKFAAADLRAGYEFAAREGLVYTEDATMCADAGKEVYYMEGSEHNIKVTTPGDMNIATLIVSRRVGNDD
jgi:2-C-methyl-D-erythritol 4-phosphate cytidylyltransferase